MRRTLSRRATLAAALLPATAASAVPVANMGVPHNRVPPLDEANLPSGQVCLREGENPDAGLVRLCAAHVANLRAYNSDRSDLDEDQNPLWRAYEATRDAISAARPASLPGLVAKALAAKAEAREVDGVERPEHGTAADWSWDTTNDLARLFGNGGDPLPPLPQKPHDDALLVDLAWQLRAAIQTEEAAWVRCSRAMGQPQEERLEEAASAATDKRESILDRIAETPATSPLGLATKSLIVSAAATGHGMTDAENAVADSLAADAARLFPALPRMEPS
ncbi:hypothetical protein [Teichococcus aerofrigidensis]